MFVRTFEVIMFLPFCLRKKKFRQKDTFFFFLLLTPLLPPPLPPPLFLLLPFFLIQFNKLKLKACSIPCSIT